MSKIEYLKPVKGSTNTEYFNQLIDSLEITQNTIKYLGRTKKLMAHANGDYYSPILNDNKWTADLRKAWERYVINRWREIDVFNQWCKDHKSKLVEQVINFSFQRKDFNLYFMKNGIHLDCYVRDNPKCFQLELLTNTQSKDFYKECVTYLRNCSGDMQKIIRYFSKDCALIDRLKFDISNGTNRITKIAHCSNDHKEPCFTYIPLIKPKTLSKSSVDAWLLFIGQFATEMQQELIMAWIYGLYYAKDNGRQILCIEGPAKIGKSTFQSVIMEDFHSFNTKSARALPSDSRSFDMFALHEMQYCRLLTLADPSHGNVFDRHDIYNITGRDYTYVRSVCKNPITVRLQAKILIISNYPPIYDKNRSEQNTRLIHVWTNEKNVKKVQDIIQSEGLNNKLEQKMKKQIRNFIAYCEPYYKKHLGKDGLLHA